ncbi:hypothetical protein NIES4075_40750 [Tolypothrix sp. NIES-4075]|nr:hypothetical protein NIES4075_40750 [Tolypothrix sp. NIES-4075]
MFCAPNCEYIPDTFFAPITAKKTGGFKDNACKQQVETFRWNVSTPKNRQPVFYFEMPAKFNLAPIGNLCIFAPDTDACIKYVSISDI